MENRKYLLWISAKNLQHKVKLDDSRLFDVALHDYGPWGTSKSSSDYDYLIPSEGTEKFETAAANLPALLQRKYAAYAFLDDDIETDTHNLNLLFTYGSAFGLDLYQPALTTNSYSTYPWLYQSRSILGSEFDPEVRTVPFVEIMCPFFSERALASCLWSFDLNQSAWGLDCYIWPRIIEGGCVVDRFPVSHRRAPGRRDRVNRNGLTPFQELGIVKKIRYDGPNPW